MTAELYTWASVINTDEGVTDTANRREILPEEALNGWVRDGTISTQQLNSLFYYLTLYASPFPNTPYLMSTKVNTPTNAYELDGSAITQGEAPNLYDIYGATLPDLSSEAPTGHRWVVRIS